MAFRSEELTPQIIKITPRTGLFGQNLAVWSTGYGYPVATFMWNIAAARAAANQGEVDLIVKARMEITQENYNDAYNAIVLESGLFKLKADRENQSFEA